MSAQKPDERLKTSKPAQQEALSDDALEKVVGGLKKNLGATRPKSGLSADPCEGGE